VLAVLRRARSLGAQSLDSAAGSAAAGSARSLRSAAGGAASAGGAGLVARALKEVGV
jgi:hypothetical protein